MFLYFCCLRYKQVLNQIKKKWSNIQWIQSCKSNVMSVNNNRSVNHSESHVLRRLSSYAPVTGTSTASCTPLVSTYTQSPSSSPFTNPSVGNNNLLNVSNNSLEPLRNGGSPMLTHITDCPAWLSPILLSTDLCLSISFANCDVTQQQNVCHILKRSSNETYGSWSHVKSTNQPKSMAGEVLMNGKRINWQELREKIELQQQQIEWQVNPCLGIPKLKLRRKGLWGENWHKRWALNTWVILLFLKLNQN